MKIKLDWPVDSVKDTLKIFEKYNFVSASIDCNNGIPQVVLEGTSRQLLNFVFGHYNDFNNDVLTTQDFYDCVVEN